MVGKGLGGGPNDRNETNRSGISLLEPGVPIFFSPFWAEFLLGVMCKGEV